MPPRPRSSWKQWTGISGVHQAILRPGVAVPVPDHLMVNSRIGDEAVVQTILDGMQRH